jgi:multimeric flavodoxin WrbA
LFRVITLKVCGIIGSPCKGGNVDLLVSQVLRGAASQGAKTLTIYLDSLKIKPCQSCGVDPGRKHCLFNDDMEHVYDALETSDAIVLGSPVYFDTVSAQVKLMIDRSNCLMPYVKKADGTFGFERRVKRKKKGVFIAVAGTDQEFNVILTTVKGFFNWTNTELVETFFYAHGDNELGGIRKDQEKMKQAFDVGTRISQKTSSTPPHYVDNG